MTDRPWGLMAEFETPDDLVRAAREAFEAGYRRMDAYSPAPVEGLAEAMGVESTRMPLITLIGGICGGLTAYLVQWYTVVADWPLNVGGRAPHSWPAFLVLTFELTILGAGLFAFLGVMAANRLPEPYHPVFNVASFERASRDAFFLAIEAADPRFDPEGTRRFLMGLGCVEVTDVAP